MRDSRAKRWLHFFVGLSSTFLPSVRRSDVILGCTFFGLIALVIAWEWPRGSVTDVEQSEGEIICYVGDVMPGSKSTRNVPIRNKTSSSLTIKSVSRSCSCLAINLDHETIPPGGVATLTVTFLAPNRQGGFRHELVVRFAGGEDPIIIRLLGTVSAWIQSSVSVLEFGDTFPGEVSCQRLQLKVREPWPEEQRRIQSLMPYTQVESAATEDDGKTVTYTIAFHPPADAESKECEGDLVIGWAGRLDDRGFKLPCKAKVASEWLSDPPQVVLGKVSLKKPPSFTIYIRNQRYSEDVWRQRYKVIADSSGLIDVSSTWDSGRWRVTGSVRKERLLRPRVQSAALCVTAPDGRVPFRVPVYWEVEP